MSDLGKYYYVNLLIGQMVIISTDQGVKKWWLIKKHCPSSIAYEHICGRSDSLDHSTSIPALASISFHNTRYNTDGIVVQVLNMILVPAVRYPNGIVNSELN